MAIKGIKWTEKHREKRVAGMRKELDEWLLEEQSKHRLCACGCGKERIILRSHHYNDKPRKD